MDDEELFEGDDAREQDCHALAVLAAGGIDGDERTAFDQVLALSGDGDGASAAKRSGAAHASRPSWSVSFMSGVTLTNSGETAYSGAAVFLGDVGHGGSPVGGAARGPLCGLPRFARRQRAATSWRGTSRRW